MKKEKALRIFIKKYGNVLSREEKNFVVQAINWYPKKKIEGDITESIKRIMMMFVAWQMRMENELRKNNGHITINSLDEIGYMVAEQMGYKY